MDNKSIGCGCTCSKYSEGSYESIKAAADYILAITRVRPKIGLICGTGMSKAHVELQLCSVPTIINVENEINYADIPNFPTSTVKGHEGKLILGYIGDAPVMCMKGRVHYCEGYDISKCIVPVRVMKLCGVTHLVASNAAGALNKNFKIGDIMLIKDHVNFIGMAGVNPLRGPNDERFGPRFVPTDGMYDEKMRVLAKQAAREVDCDMKFHEGVYAMVSGPNFETVAESRLLQILGVDTVGMSTAVEALAAHHCGIKFFAFSLITNECNLDYENQGRIDHDDVLASGIRMELMVKSWITRLVLHISRELC